MARTFHPKLNRTILLLILLPATLMMVYGFWVRLWWVVLIFAILMVLCIERLIHTEYVLMDDGQLTLSHGRFSRPMHINVQQIAKMEIFRPQFPARLWQSECVLLTLEGGRQIILRPETPETFCRAVLRMQEKDTENELQK